MNSLRRFAVAVVIVSVIGLGIFWIVRQQYRGRVARVMSAEINEWARSNERMSPLTVKAPAKGADYVAVVPPYSCVTVDFDKDPDPSVASCITQYSAHSGNKANRLLIIQDARIVAESDFSGSVRVGPEAHAWRVQNGQITIRVRLQGEEVLFGE
jgi:hypothetical protein